jgi:hypothetical protein
MFYVNNYLFLPSSNNAELGIGSGEFHSSISNESNVFPGIGSLPMTSTAYTNGTWSPYTGGYPGSSYHEFADGVYTVAVGDEWGQLVVLHFVVTNQPQSVPTETSLSNSNPLTFSCSTEYSNGTGVGMSLYLAKGSGSSVNLCVRFFYYNSSTTITINTLNQLTIYSPIQSSGTLVNANSSFSISASTPQVEIGGPLNENEGSLVVYTINSIDSAPSATYEIALSSGLYPKDIICAYGIYVALQVGNTTNPIVTSSCHYVPPPQDNPGLIYSEIIGLTNST